MFDNFQENNEQNQNGEFLDEFRQRLNSQPIESMEERKNDINRSQHIFIGTILGIGLAGVASWFILSPQYNSTSDADIPVIRRPHTSVKMQPSDPGGMEILNQDKTVYDIVEKTDVSVAKVENLLPPPEEPKLPPIEENVEIKAEINSVDTAIDNAKKIIDMEQSPKIAPTPEINNQQPITKEEIKAEIKTEIKTETPTNQPTKIIAEKPTPQPQPTTPQESPKAPTAEKSASIPAGSWQIQLISSPNKSAMDKAWNSLTKKYNALKGLPHEIESADLGSKGTFYRLKAGAFKTRSEADKLCNSIKSSGGSCLVKRK